MKSTILSFAILATPLIAAASPAQKNLDCQDIRMESSYQLRISGSVDDNSGSANLWITENSKGALNTSLGINANVASSSKGTSLTAPLFKLELSSGCTAGKCIGQISMDAGLTHLVHEPIVCALTVAH